jgi:hypothetical protein
MGDSVTLVSPHPVPASGTPSAGSALRAGQPVPLPSAAPTGTVPEPRSAPCSGGDVLGTHRISEIHRCTLRTPAPRRRAISSIATLRRAMRTSPKFSADDATVAKAVRATAVRRSGPNRARMRYRQLPFPAPSSDFGRRPFGLPLLAASRSARRSFASTICSTAGSSRVSPRPRGAKAVVAGIEDAHAQRLLLPFRQRLDWIQDRGSNPFAKAHAPSARLYRRQQSLGLSYPCLDGAALDLELVGSIGSVWH